MEPKRTPELLRILSLSTVFPSREAPAAGLFVASRLRALATLAEVQVLAPVPWIDYARLWRRARAGPRFPGGPHDSPLAVIHPRWFYPPGGGAVNGVFLFASLLVPALRLRRKSRFQVIDSHWAHPEGVAAGLLARFFRIPYSVTLRGSEYLHCQHPWRRRAIRWALRNAALVIAVSERLRELAITLGADTETTCVIPNGVDAAVFYPRNTSPYRETLHLSEQARIILAAGRLIEPKGHHHIVQALAPILAEGFDIHLCIAGGPGSQSANFSTHLTALAERLGVGSRLHLLGELPQEELAGWMSAADLFCLASHREGWPNVVHEALSCGTPVVSTNVGGAPDLLPTEEYGYLVPSGDQEALERALAKALGRHWNRPAIAAWGQSRTWERVAAEVIEHLRSCAALADKGRTRVA